MSEWKEFKLGEISEDVSYGYTESANEKPVGPKFLRITDIRDGIINWNNVPYCIINEKDFVKNKIEIGDIVIARTGATTGITQTIKHDVNAVFASYLIRFKINKSKANPFYIGYILKSNVWNDYVSSIVSGSAQPGANAKQFSDFSYKIPDLPTQTAIAEILSSLDDKIELNNKINQELENLAQTLFKQWFIDFEFPNANGKPYKTSGGEMVDSELGEIPKGWNISNIGDWGQVVCGKTPSKSKKEYFGEDILFIKIPDMHNNVFVTKTEDGLSSIGANSQKNKLLKRGTVILSSIATVGLVSIVSKDSQTNQQINAIIPNNRIYTCFLYLMLKTKTDDFKQLASGGSATLNMNTSTFKAYKLLMPNELLLTQFDEFVNDLFENIYLQSLESQELTNLRDTLLPKLISGELELK